MRTVVAVVDRTDEDGSRFQLNAATTLRIAATPLAPLGGLAVHRAILLIACFGLFQSRAFLASVLLARLNRAGALLGPYPTSKRACAPLAPSRNFAVYSRGRRSLSRGRSGRSSLWCSIQIAHEHSRVVIIGTSGLRRKLCSAWNLSKEVKLILAVCIAVRGVAANAA